MSGPTAIEQCIAAVRQGSTVLRGGALADEAETELETLRKQVANLQREWSAARADSAALAKVREILAPLVELQAENERNSTARDWERLNESEAALERGLWRALNPLLAATARGEEEK